MLTITPSARKQVMSILERAEDPQTALRVFVSPGGCSGMSYGMQLDSERQDGDTVIEDGGVRLVVDEMSAMYLTGSQIDFVDALMGGGFAINNPNVVAACGCGSSFQAKDDVDGEPVAAASGGGCGSCASH